MSYLLILINKSLIFSLYLLPFFISGAIGYLLLEWLFEQRDRPKALLALSFSFGLGLGVSAVLTFLSFLILNAFHPGFILALHGLLLFVLVLNYLFRRVKKNFTLPDRQEGLAFIILCAAMIPVSIIANFYPQGGWDAWSVWNYKAKFLFLAGSDWREVFAPYLWRSSPHYPLLLPLVNVWGWVFSPAPVPLVPLVVALLFTFLTALLLYAAIKDLTQSPWAITAPLLLLSLPFFTTLATSQYGDIVIGFFLLASFFCLVKTLSQPSRGYCALAGFFLGFLSFIKPEGEVVVLLATMVFTVLWLSKVTLEQKTKKRLFLIFWASLLVGSIATFVFQATLSPGNQTYINGFLSTEKPVSWYRLKIILVFLLVELKGDKWNGVWLLLGLGMILMGKKIWRREFLLVPLVLFLYLGVVLFYYLVNTYFKIEWWLQVTLSRIVFALLPSFLFWVFYGLKKDALPIQIPERSQGTADK